VNHNIEEIVAHAVIFNFSSGMITKIFVYIYFSIFLSASTNKLEPFSLLVNTGLIQTYLFHNVIKYDGYIFLQPAKKILHSV